MKRKLALSITVLLSICITTHAQVTIGSNSAPNVNALLDLKEQNSGTSTKGLLLPRVALTTTTSSAPMSNHEKGMTVYNTATTGDVTPGYYYNNGSKWVRLADSFTTDNGLTKTENNVQLGGTLTKGTTIAQADQSLSITSTNTTSSSAAFGTYNTALNLTATNKGFMPPRVALKGNSDNVTVPVTSSDKGMVVYHTDYTIMEEGLYAWDGNSWKQLITQIPESPDKQVSMFYQTENVRGGIANGADQSQMVSLKFSPNGYEHNPATIKLPEAGSYAFNVKLYSRIEDMTTPNEEYKPTTPFKYICYVGIWVDDILQDVSEVFAQALPFEGGAIMDITNVANVVLGAKGNAGQTIDIRFGYLPSCIGPNTSMVSQGVTAWTPRSNRTSMIFWKL